MDKLLKSQCRSILQNESALLQFMKEEEESIVHADLQGESAFEIAQEYIKGRGIIEGQQRLLRKISKYARETTDT